VQAGTIYGAGVLLDAHGHVVTCLHVVEGQARIDVSFDDAGPFVATLVDSDSELDLALLELPTERAPSVALGSIVGMTMGDTLFTMGAPRHMAYSLSRGIVSFLKRPFGSVSYLQTDLPFNGGSSGGPVLNERGELVAIASFVVRDTQGVSFALPIDYAAAHEVARVQRDASCSASLRARPLVACSFHDAGFGCDVGEGTACGASTAFSAGRMRDPRLLA
jgi:S1-C subfamily serine protease